MSNNINDLFTKYGIKRFPFPEQKPVSQNEPPNLQENSFKFPLESVDIVKIESSGNVTTNLFILLS